MVERAESTYWKTYVKDEITDSTIQGVNHHLLEEVVGLIRARGCTESEAHQLVHQVFNNPMGDLTSLAVRSVVTLGVILTHEQIEMPSAQQFEQNSFTFLQDLAKAKVQPIDESMFERSVKGAIKYLAAKENGLTSSQGKSIISLFNRQKLAAIRLAIKAITIAARNGMLHN